VLHGSGSWDVIGESGAELLKSSGAVGYMLPRCHIDRVDVAACKKYVINPCTQIFIMITTITHPYCTINLRLEEPHVSQKLQAF